MYRRILKKDLKRKKTMNVILLLFVILSAAFAASGVNNILSVIGGMDGYFDKAGLSDYVVVAREADGDSPMKRTIDSEPAVESYEIERGLLFTSEKLKIRGKASDSSKWSFIMNVEDTRLNFFDSDNDKITKVKKGEAYATTPLKNNFGAKVGDTVTFKNGDKEYSYKIVGFAKDALFGSALMNCPRLLIDPEDYAEILSDEEGVKGLNCSIYYIKSDDVSAIKTAIASVPNAGVIYGGDREMIKTAYIMNMVVAILLAIVAACLLIVAFVTLRFTIGFTIAEEFREIGVMKAIGIKNGSIRAIYIVKYAAIAVVGTAVGLAASFPLGKLLLQSASEVLVLETSNPIGVALLCGLAVILLIIWFGWSSTAKIKKLSPIDAVRCGQSGERFRKKRGFRIGRSRLGATGYLAVNDVASSPRSYVMIISVFTVCVILASMISTAANTFCSRKLIQLFGVTESDIFIDNGESMFDYVIGKKTLDEALGEVEDTVEELGYHGKARAEIFYKASVVNGDKKMLLHLIQCKGTDASDYKYDKGKAPANADEIAVTYAVADNLGVGIGDKVVVDMGDSQKEFLVTAIFNSMIQMGEAGRLHQDAELPRELVSAYFQTQVDFDDSPDDAEIARRIEKLEDVYGEGKVFDADEFVRISAGVADIFKALEKFVTALSVVIIVMITILMERSFIAKEKSEIALMKAIGFGNGSIIAQHVLRFVIASAVACIAGAALSYPVTKLVCDPIMGLVGVKGGVCYSMSVPDLIFKRPLIIIAAAAAGAFFTALYTRTIKSSDAGDIE